MISIKNWIAWALLSTFFAGLTAILAKIGMKNVLRCGLGLVLTVVAALIGGCGSLPSGDRWGEDAIWPVSGQRIIKAAKDALLDPQTWVPAAGALVFAIDDWDHKASDWATEHTPIFGSQKDAKQASDDLWSILKAELLVTALATPSGDDPQQWAVAKAKGLAVEYGAIAVNGYTTDWIKDGVGRQRPNGDDYKSFPSGHVSSSFAHTTLSNRNFDSIVMPKGIRRACQISNLALAGGVAWARVEAKAHYPSDVLAAAALGHFLTAFIYDAFMNLPENSPIDVAITPLDGGGALSVAFCF